MNGFKKIVEAEKLYAEFLKSATPEDLKMVTKKALERLDKIKKTLFPNQEKVVDNVLPFTKKITDKDTLN